eukprot:Em0013g692a
MKSINVSLSSQQLRDILYVVTNEAIPGKGMEFEEFVFLSLFLARYFQKINADVLVQDWVRGSPAAIDITVTSPLTPAMLRDASTSAGSAAYAAECRKHEANDTKCQELGWTCIPLAVETFGHWGKEAQAVFSRLASFIPSIELVPNPVS